MTSLLFKCDIARCYATTYQKWLYPFDVLFKLSDNSWSSVLDESPDNLENIRLVMKHTIQRDMFAIDETERTSISYSLTSVFELAAENGSHDIIMQLAPHCSAFTFWRCIKFLCSNNTLRAVDTLELLIRVCPQYTVDWNIILANACRAYKNKSGMKLAIRRGATWCVSCQNKKHPEISTRPVVYQI